MTVRSRKLLSAILVLVMLISILPVSAFAANDSVVVIAASDYQLSNSGTIMTNIMNHIKNDFGTAYGALLGGDYDAGSVSTKASHIQAVDDVISGVFPEIASENRIYIQGNHENYAGLKVDGTNLMDESGAHDTAYYGVFVINHDDFPWTTSSNPSPSEALVQKTANALGDYLEAKVAEGYTKPIFVTSHLPLHATTRGDNRYAKLIFDELEAAGEAGLNIIYLVGHNHSGGYDQYLGNGSFYLPEGSSLTVVEGTSGKYTDSSINFTYMNYGYLGKISGSACTHQTMTAFEITGNQVTVKRYAADGAHQLKAAGAAVSGFNTDSNVIGTEGAIIELGEPEPTFTVTDNNVSVTSAGLTGLTATKLFGTDSTSSYDSATYCAYASYDITPEGYTQGKSATVTITLDDADKFDASKAVLLIDAEKGTETKTKIVNGTVTFTTNHFSTYNIAQKATKEGTYELVSEIEAGESYVIVGKDHPVALMDNSGSLGSMNVTISGDTLTSEEELTEWTFSSATSGTITSANGNKLGYSSSSWNLSGSGDCSFDIGTGSDSFSLRVIRASSGYSRYYFYYDGSSWAKNSGSTASYVRLYKLAEGSSTTPETPDVPETPTEPETPDVPETPTEPETPDVPTTENEWIALPAGNTYVLDTDGIDNGAKYLIVAKSYAKALNAAASSGNAVSVTIDGNNATADAANGWTFTASGNAYTIEKNGTYLGRSSSKLAAGNSGSTWTVSNSGNGQYTITQSGSGSSWWGSSSKYYVRWSNSNNYFQASSSSTDPVRLYKYAGSGSAIGANYIRLAGTTAQEYTIAEAASLNTVLGKLAIQTSADGVNADAATLAVTADMVSWNTAFDGKTAGTYVGTVTCEDKVLGTVTVTVTGAHEYETVRVEATCTTDGSVTTTCTVCGEQTVEVIPAIGHSYTCVETAATCGQAGSKVYTCANCNDSYTEVIPATGKHTYETTTVDATCAAAGSVTYTCSCGDSYTEVIPATGKHTYETVTVDADCTTAGSKTHTCTACGDSYTEEIPALGHTYTAEVTAPTCEKAGYTTYTCACGDSYTADEVPALGHTYTAKVTAATCTQDGVCVYTCACGDSYTEVIPAIGHSYYAKVTAPTCTETGFTTYTCPCGDTYTADEVPALGHSYTAKVTAPTCTEAGFTTYTCACGDSYTADEVPALGHTYTAKVTAPTCEKAGYTTYTCACGDSYTADEVPALGHSYTAKVTAPTCEKAGYTTYTCACGDSYTADEVPALGHTYTTEVIAPTCEQTGATVYTCDCGHSYSEKIAALGHDYASVVTAPTCTEAGFTTYTCAVCGDSYTGDQVAALGHNYTAVESDGYMVYTCGTCGHSYSEKLENLTYTKVSSISSGNAYVITFKSGSSYYAMSHANNKISAVKVTISNNVITSEVTEDLVWNYSGSKLSYEDNGTTYYLYAQSSGWWGWGTPTLTLSTSNSTSITFSSSKVKMSNYYLRYSSGTVSLNRSATTTYFFVED